jgi:hypothetical protein
MGRSRQPPKWRFKVNASSRKQIEDRPRREMRTEGKMKRNRNPAGYMYRSCDLKSTLAQNTQRSKILRPLSFSALRVARTGANEIDLLEVAQ